MLMREQLLGPVPLRLRAASSCPQCLRLRPLRLQEEDMTPEVLRTMLLILTGAPNPGSIQQGGALLYLCQNRGDFVNQMPIFDEWGPHPAGIQGPRENPVCVLPLFVTGAELVPNVGAGGRAPPEVGGTSADVRTPPGAPGVSSL